MEGPTVGLPRRRKPIHLAILRSASPLNKVNAAASCIEIIETPKPPTVVSSLAPRPGQLQSSVCFYRPQGGIKKETKGLL